MTDSKPDLNHFEKDWENSERAKALDAEKIKRTTTGLIGGFLNVWPRDEVERLEVENIKVRMKIILLLLFKLLV